jgi:Rps23 Pro-64 3,4-dihydroxylase Tpa1-like proline 4-hydroxylase
MPNLPLEAAARIYLNTGRVHLPGVLASDAAISVHNRLVAARSWRLVFNQAGQHREILLEDLAHRGWEGYRELLAAAAARGSTEFQYIYKNLPLYDLYRDERLTDGYLRQLMEFLNSNAFLRFARQLTGDPFIEFVDAQATLYEPGHFLTRHDDLVEGKNRAAAYVLNLTPGWNPDWGGILSFYDADGHVAEGYTPTFNAINVFRVPQVHAVSYVAPLAKSGRYSVTGWMRRGTDPSFKKASTNTNDV